jgi:hypothetical protein
MLYVHSTVVRLSMEVCNGGQLCNEVSNRSTLPLVCMKFESDCTKFRQNTRHSTVSPLCSAFHSHDARQSIILTDIYKLHLFRPLRRDVPSVCVRACVFHAAAAAVSYVATLAQ